jgi:cell division protein DivIC
MQWEQWPVIRNLPGFLRNKYVLVLLGYLVYMIFFDSNDFRSQWKLYRQKSKLEREETYYKKQIKEVKKEQSLLFSDMAQLEKFAREHYLMKRDSEDIFVIVEE